MRHLFRNVKSTGTLSCDGNTTCHSSVFVPRFLVKVVPTINQHFDLIKLHVCRCRLTFVPHRPSYQRAFDTLETSLVSGKHGLCHVFGGSFSHLAYTSPQVRPRAFENSCFYTDATPFVELDRIYIGRGYPETVLSSIMVELYWTGEHTNKMPALDDYNMMQVFSRYYGLVLRTLLRKS
jgi:hypothetical protein